MMHEGKAWMERSFDPMDTGFQRPTATAMGNPAHTNNESLESEICGAAEQALRVIKDGGKGIDD